MEPAFRAKGETIGEYLLVMRDGVVGRGDGGAGGQRVALIDEGLSRGGASQALSNAIG